MKVQILVDTTCFSTQNIPCAEIKLTVRYSTSMTPFRETFEGKLVRISSIRVEVREVT